MLLLSESELGNDSTVALDILLHQVVEEVLSLTNHLEKTATAVVVVGVLLQMLGEVSNSLGENSDLYLGRTGISFVCSIVNDDLLLYFFFQHGVHLIKIYFVQHSKRQVTFTRKPSRRSLFSARISPQAFHIIAQGFFFCNLFAKVHKLFTRIKAF